MKRNHTLVNDDCLVALMAMPDNSIDSLVTDPPAGISFMGKEWDSNKGGSKQWIAWMSEVMTECLRVLTANLLLSHSLFCTDDKCEDGCAVAMLDEQSGSLHLRGNKKETTLGGGLYGHGKFKGIGLSESGHTGASRFFYCAKASKSERNKGLEDSNNHPTVKPQKLMQYLIRMITPPNGVVLDPFMGSGSTGLAAKTLGFKFVGIEREKEYLQIAERRIGACV